MPGLESRTAAPPSHDHGWALAAPAKSKAPAVTAIPNENRANVFNWKSPLMGKSCKFWMNG